MYPFFNGKIYLRKRILIKLYLERENTIKQLKSTSYIEKYKMYMVRIKNSQTWAEFAKTKCVRFRQRVLSSIDFLLKCVEGIEIEFDCMCFIVS